MPYVKKLKLGDTTSDITHSRIITIVDAGSTTAGTWVASTEAPAGNLTEYKDGQLFLFKVAIAGASTTTLNIDSLGAKTIYRVGTTKLSTQYGVGQYLLLAYNSTNDCFRVVNDSDANSYAYVRQYQHGENAAGTSGKYPLLARYNVANKHGTYDTAYTRYHTGAYVDTSTGELYSEGSKVLTENNSTVDAVTSISGGSGSFTPTTKYLHKSTASAAPNSHTHNVTVSGTTGNNSGSAVKAVTGYASFSGGSGSASLSVYSSDTATTADTAASSGRVPYISSASHTAASLGTASTGTVSISGGSYSGTTKYMKVSTTTADTGTVGISGGSGSLTSYDASSGGNAKTSSGRVPYLHDVTLTSAKASGTDTFLKSINAGSGSLTTDTTSTDGIKYVESISSTKASASGTAKAGSETHTHNYDKTTGVSLTANAATATGRIKYVEGISGGSGNLTTDTTSTDGIKYVEAVSGGSAVSPTTKYMKFSAGTTPKSSATPNHTSTSSGSAGGGTADQNTGSATPTFTGTEVTSGGSTVLTAASVSNGVLTITSASHTHKVTAAGTVSAHTHTYTKPAAHTHTYDKTTSVSLTAGTAPSMNFDTGTNTDTPYISAVSGGSAVSATTKYLHHTHSGASATTKYLSAAPSNTSTASAGPSATTTFVTGVTGGTASATTKYLHHTHTGASAGTTADAVTGITAGSLSKTTYYLNHSHTAASLTGTKTFATNGVKAVSLSASTTSTDGPAYTESISGSAPSLGGTKTFVTGYPNFSGGSASHTTKYLKLNHTHTGASLGTASTANAAPHTHTHSYGDSTALTSTANSGTAVTAITGLTANTTKANGDITYLESATHSHTGASVSGTASVYEKED